MNTISKSMFMVLEAIRLEHDVARLSRAGLEYHQILQCVNEGMKDGLIVTSGSSVVITAAGIAAVSAARHRAGYGGPSTWIAPLESAINEPPTPDSVYLPKERWRSD